MFYERIRQIRASVGPSLARTRGRVYFGRNYNPHLLGLTSLISVEAARGSRTVTVPRIIWSVLACSLARLGPRDNGSEPRGGPIITGLRIRRPRGTGFI